MATLPELTFKINKDLVNALNQTTAENNLLRQIIKTLNPGVKVNINDIVYVDGRPLNIPPQYISENKYLCLDNGTILDKDIQIGELRKALENILCITDPLGANGNEKIYNIALNALKK